MRTQLLAATALGSTIGFLIPGALMAAETAYDWSGFYAGLGVGLADSTAQVDFSDIATPANFTAPASVRIPALGKDGSVRFGYNWQAGKLVYGIEADGTITDLAGRVTGSTYTITDSLGMLLSLRARFGVAFDRLLVYGNIGLAAGKSSFHADVSAGTPAQGSGLTTGEILGIGGEYAITDRIGLTATANYYALAPLHDHGVSDLGYASTTTYNANHTPRGLIFETGVNVHF